MELPGIVQIHACIFHLLFTKALCFTYGNIPTYQTISSLYDILVWLWLSFVKLCHLFLCMYTPEYAGGNNHESNLSENPFFQFRLLINLTSIWRPMIWNYHIYNIVEFDLISIWTTPHWMKSPLMQKWYSVRLVYCGSIIISVGVYQYI